MKLNNIYVFKTYGSDGRVLYKLGYSSNIVERIRSYTYHNPLIELVKTYHFEKGLEFEQYIHNNFKAVIRREWYDEETIINIMDNIELIYTKGLSNKFKDSKPFPSLGNLYKEYLETEDKESYLLEYPEFEEYDEYLELTEMNTLKFNKEKLDNLVRDKKVLETLHYKIAKTIKMDFISSREAKELYNKEIVKNKLNIKATGTMIKSNPYLECKPTTKRVGGKLVRGFEIVRKAYRINK